MASIQIGRLNLEGRKELARIVTRDGEGTAPVERGENLDHVLVDPRYCTPIEGAGTIETEAKFKTNLDLLRHIWWALGPVLGNEPSRYVEDAGVNAFLAAAFIRQITEKARSRSRGLRVPEAYVLDLHEVSGGRTRNYRNTLFVTMFFYSLYREEASLCEMFLGNDLGELSNPLERMCQRVDFMASLGAWKLVQAMFTDPAKPGKFVSTKKAKLPPGTLQPGDALETVSIILFSQCAANYEVEDMEAKELLALLPRSPSVAYWRDRAADVLGVAGAPGRERAPR